jgi:hypothetical protein
MWHISRARGHNRQLVLVIATTGTVHGALTPCFDKIRQSGPKHLWSSALSSVLTQKLLLTFSLAFTSASPSIRALTASVCPFMAAQIRAVLPSCETNIRHEATAGLASSDKARCHWLSEKQAWVSERNRYAGATHVLNRWGPQP